MANSLLQPQSLQRRKNIRDNLLRIDTLDDDARLAERYKLMDDLDKDLEQLKFFRPMSLKSQNIQDSHFELYETFVLKWLQGYTDEDLEQLDEDQKSLICFPDDEKQLGSMLNMYVMHQIPWLSMHPLTLLS